MRVLVLLNETPSGAKCSVRFNVGFLINEIDRVIDMRAKKHKYLKAVVRFIAFYLLEQCNNISVVISNLVLWFLPLLYWFIL